MMLVEPVFGQTYYTCTSGDWTGSEVWKNTSDCTGEFVSPPNPSNNNLEITINNDVVVTSGLNFANNFKSLTVNGTLIVNGDLGFPNGTSDEVKIGNGGMLIVTGSYNHPSNNNNIAIEDGGSFIVYENFIANCNMDVYGQLNVSGNLSFDTSPGRNLDVSSTGEIVVGGDLTLGGGTVDFKSGSYLGVLGNAEFVSQNFPTQNGEFDVLGNTTGTNIPTGITDDISPDDPFLDDITYGMHVIDFLTVDDISEVPYQNTSADSYNGVIWESEQYFTDCHRNIHISADVMLTGCSYGDVYLRYSIDGITWSDASSFSLYDEDNMYRRDDIEAVAGYVYVQLYANEMPGGSTASLDNVTIAATNEGGTPAIAIEWDVFTNDICPPEEGAYSIEDNSYSSIVWEATGGVIEAGQSTVSCTVDWNSMPGTIKVTVTGGDCGGSSQTLYSERTVSESEFLEVFVDKTDIDCNGNDNGEISVEGRCGDESESVVYKWTDWPTGYTILDDTDPSIIDLPPGNYSIKVTRGAEEINRTIEIIDPDPLSVTYNEDQTKDYICSEGDDFGIIAVEISGGTKPYSEPELYKDGSVYSGTSTWNEPVGGVYTIENLETGTYFVTVTDANSCTAQTENRDVFVDNEDPTFVDFPANIQMTMEEYQTYLEEGDVEEASFDLGSVSSTLNSSTTEVVRTNFSIDDTYHNMVLTFDVFQSGDTPTDDDELTIEVSYDDEGVEPGDIEWSTVETFSNAVSGSQSISLGDAADGETSIQVRFTATISTSGLEYTISNVQVSGSRFPLSIGGGPPACDDNSGVCTVTHEDSDPIWSDCISYDDGEFYIRRRWTVVDDCGYDTYRDQYISVGEAPEFDTDNFPADAVFNFCHLTQSITAPTATDGCGEIEISWVVLNEANEEIGDGTCEEGVNVDISFTPEEYGVEYDIVWTATDDAQIPVTQTQHIVILDEISGTIETNLEVGDVDVCLEEQVEFTITPSGGSGVYDIEIDDFTPSGGTWDPENNRYTTDLTDAQNTLKVTITDADNNDFEYNSKTYTIKGGCEGTIETGEFTVHELIETKPVDRVVE